MSSTKHIKYKLNFPFKKLEMWKKFLKYKQYNKQYISNYLHVYVSTKYQQWKYIFHSPQSSFPHFQKDYLYSLVCIFPVLFLWDVYLFCYI